MGWTHACWYRSRRATVLLFVLFLPVNIAEQKVILQTWQALPFCHKTRNLLSLSSPLPLSQFFPRHS